MSRFDLTTREGLSRWIAHYSIEVIREGAWSGRGGEGDYRWIIKCKWHESHTDNAAYILRFKNGAIAAGCQHNSCEGKSWHDLRETVEPGGRDIHDGIHGSVNRHYRNGSNGFKNGVHDSRSPSSREAVNREPVPLWGFEKPDPLKWFVHRFIPSGFVTLLAADGGTGKSYLAIYLALCICLGRSFLGLPVLRGRVLYVDYELDEDEQKRRVWRVVTGMGMTVDDPGLAGRFYYHRPYAPLSKDEGHDEVISIIKRHEINLVVLDSLTIGSGADVTSQQDVTSIMQRFKDWGTVFAIDHVSGQAARGNASRARPFGSVFKRNIARSTFTLARAEAGGYLLTPDKNNFGPVQDLLCYGIDFDDDADKVTFRRLDHADEEMTGAMQHMDTHEVTLLAVKELCAETRDGALVREGASAEDVVAWRAAHDAAPVKAGTVRNHFTVLKRRGKIELLGDGTACPVHDSRLLDYLGTVNRESPNSAQNGHFTDEHEKPIVNDEAGHEPSGDGLPGNHAEPSAPPETMLTHAGDVVTVKRRDGDRTLGIVRRGEDFIEQWFEKGELVPF